MANFPGRNDRRRRVLNDEVLSASRSHLALRAAPPELADGRYGEAAGVEHHPHVSDFVPRRLGSIAFVVATGIAITGGVVGLRLMETTLVAGNELINSAPHLFNASRGVAEWIGCVTLLLASATCALIHSIRRHRLDDDRGRYRIWKWASATCLLASANSIIGLHTLVAELGGHFTGWTALRDGAVWWLALGLPAAWIAVRASYDTRESRTAMTLVGLSGVAYAAAAASFLGWLPRVDVQLEPLVTAGCGLLGNWLLFGGMLSFARYVVLDAEGLIDHTRTSEHTTAEQETSSDAVERTAKPSETSRQSPPATLRIADSAPAAIRDSAVSGKDQTKKHEWVDGSRRKRDRFDSEEDEDEDTDGRKFSKTERKQMRKLKARNRAA